MGKKVSLELDQIQLARLEQAPAVMAAARANPLIRSQPSVMAALQEMQDVCTALAMAAADQDEQPAQRQWRPPPAPAPQRKVPWEMAQPPWELGQPPAK